MAIPMAQPLLQSYTATGERKSVSAYTINDYTYYKLRDLAKLLDMGVTWEEGSATIGINTAKSYQ